MKKFFAALLAVCMLLALCTACGGDSGSETETSTDSTETTAPETSGGETVVLRLANSHNAEHITRPARCLPIW